MRDLTRVSLDFQSHFKDIAKQHSPEERRFYVHLTSVVVCIGYGIIACILLRTFFAGHSWHRDYA